MELFLPVVSAVLALAGALGVAYAVFRSATVQKTLDLYKAENEALGKAVARQQADLVEVSTRVEQLQRENSVLRETVTSRAAVEELARSQSEEHREQLALLREMKEQLAELWRGVIRNLGDR